MTSPGDRPAAELLAEWMTGRWRLAATSEYGTRELLTRLAHAERALAEARVETLQLGLVVADQAEAIADAWDEGRAAYDQWQLDEKRQWVEMRNPYLAALRASQGGQT